MLHTTPRRLHDQGGHTAAEKADPHRRSSSDATPSDSDLFTSPSTTKRLGLFAEKLSSHSNLKSSLHTPSPMAAASSIANVAKSHSSPSKVSYGRTYDSKVVTREMHRLANLSHLPSPPIATAPSSASLALPAVTTPAVLASTSSNDPWGALHVHVLPLFNGEHLRIPIEDLNVLVKRHIQSVVSSSPSKALTTLENGASELIASGMVTLNAKLLGIDDEKLVARVVEIWGFFWDQVLTYVEGVLLPLQTDPLLSSLHRNPKSHHRATSPNRQDTKGTVSSLLGSSTSASHIDVRSVALRSFRDKVILPLFPRLYTRLSMPNRHDNYQETSTYQQPRLQQMLLVLTSQRRPRPVAFSLTTPVPTPTAGEQAINDLLRVVRSPRPQYDSRAQALKKPGPMSPLSRAPSFFSGGLPRDRRGRIAHKHHNGKVPQLTGLVGGGGYGEDGEDGRGGPVSYPADLEREREREILESLRSPDVDASANTRASVGGWGLGAGHEDIGKTVDEEEEEEMLDWNSAQAIVEQMVGMASPQENRRRMT